MNHGYERRQDGKIWVTLYKLRNLIGEFDGMKIVIEDHGKQVDPCQIKSRDLADIRKSKLPVFARAVVPNAGGAEYVGELQVSVSCGGQVVNPGDWLVGDDDGVVVIPLAQLEAAVAKAAKIVEAERRIAKAIRAGADIAALLRVDELLESKRQQIFVPQLRVK